MTGKELIFQTLRHEPTPRAPWVPFAGVHAGALVGATATQVLTDEETLVRALLEVNRLYKPDGQPRCIRSSAGGRGTGLRAGVGRRLPALRFFASSGRHDDGALPLHASHSESGRMPMVLSAMRRMKEAVGDTTALYGLLCGPFTLASHLRGNDIFMDMFDDEDYVKDLLGFCADCAKRMSDLYLDAGMDVIAVVDPLVSQISSDHFEEFLSAPYTELFRYLREEKQAFSSFFVCGNATRNIEVMCRTAPDSISVDENVDILAAKAICDKYNVAIGGNIPLTSIMLHGTQQDNMKFVADLLAQLPEYKNFIVAPGCDMPYAVPVENTIGAAQAVLETEAVREMVKNYVAAEDDIAVELPDYENLPRPLIEVFTLDSATCAACTYMMGAANVAKDTFGDAIDMVEYKFTLKENIARCKKMGVKNLPSIYINGKLKFSSIIPSKEELEAAVREVL